MSKNKLKSKGNFPRKVTQQKIVKNEMSIQGRFIRISSPIPPPEVMKDYENIMSGAMEKFFTIADEQRVHRHAIEKQEVKWQNFRANFGLICGWLSVLFFGGIGAFLLYIGKNIAGYTFFLSAVVPRVLSFIYSRSVRKRDIEENNK